MTFNSQKLKTHIHVHMIKSITLFHSTDSGMHLPCSMPNVCQLDYIHYHRFLQNYSGIHIQMFILGLIILIDLSEFLFVYFNALIMSSQYS